MGEPEVTMTLGDVERRHLDPPARAHKARQAMARRARIVLAGESGLENKAICAEVSVNADIVSK
jgi:hypothetical protein